MIVLVAIVVIILLLFTFSLTNGGDEYKTSVMDFAIKHYNVKPIEFTCANKNDFKNFPVLSSAPKIVEKIKDKNSRCLISVGGNNQDLCVFSSVVRFLVGTLPNQHTKSIVVIRAPRAKIFNILAVKFPNIKFIILEEKNISELEIKSLAGTKNLKAIPKHISLFYLDFKSSKKDFLSIKKILKPKQWFFASDEYIPCDFIWALPWRNDKAVGMCGNGNNLVKSNLNYYNSVYKSFAFHGDCTSFISGRGFDGCSDCFYLLSSLKAYDKKFSCFDAERDLLALQHSTNFFTNAHGFFTKQIKNISELEKLLLFNNHMLVTKSHKFTVSNNLPSLLDGVVAFKLCLKKHLCALNWWSFAKSLAIYEGVEAEELKTRKKILSEKISPDYVFSNNSSVIKVRDLSFSVSVKTLNLWKNVKSEIISDYDFEKLCMDTCFRNSSDSLCLKLNPNAMENLIDSISVKTVINLCDDFTRSGLVNCNYKKPFLLHVHYPKLNPVTSVVSHFLSLIPDSSLVYIESRIPDYLTTHLLYSLTRQNSGIYFIVVLYDYPYDIAFCKKMLVKAKMHCCDNSFIPKSICIATNIKSESFVLDLFL